MHYTNHKFTPIPFSPFLYEVTPMKEKIINWFKETFNPDIENAYDEYTEMHEPETQKRLEHDYNAIVKGFKKELHKKAKEQSIETHIAVNFHLSHTEEWYIERLVIYAQEKFNHEELKDKNFQVTVHIQQGFDNSGYIMDTAKLEITFTNKTQTQEKK